MANAKGDVQAAGLTAGAAQFVPQAPLDSMDQLLIAENLKTQMRLKIKNEDLVSVTLAPTYRHPFGKVMPVRLNGYSIFVPCNGRAYKIPKSYAAIVHARRRAYDEQEMRQESMAQVQNNFEQYPGQLQWG